MSLRDTAASRSAKALPENIRKTLEESNLPVEVATAIADKLERDAKDAERYRWLRSRYRRPFKVHGQWFRPERSIRPWAGWRRRRWFVGMRNARWAEHFRTSQLMGEYNANGCFDGRWGCRLKSLHATSKGTRA